MFKDTTTPTKPSRRTAVSPTTMMVWGRRSHSPGEPDGHQGGTTGSFSGNIISFERVLGGRRRGEHHVPLVLEFLKSAHLGISFGDTACWKGLAVAAVEYKDLLPRRAGIDDIVQWSTAA